MKKVTVLFPSYSPRFRCKCGHCRAVCCHGWHIDLTAREYFSLTAAQFSSALSAKAEHAFLLYSDASADRYAYINHGADGKCPMLDADGLCLLQKECGAEALPAVCRLYPRAVRPGHPVEFVCANSCEATVELLMQMPTPLTFETAEADIESGMPPYESESEEERALRFACIAALMAQDAPLTERLQEVGRRLGVAMRAETEESFLTRAHKMLQAFGRGESSISSLAAQATDTFFKGGVTSQSVRDFRVAAQRLFARFPRAWAWYENLLVNHLFFMRFPARGISRAEAYEALLSVWALLLTLTVSHTDTDGTETSFADAAAAVFRRIEHSGFYEIAPHLTEKHT